MKYWERTGDGRDRLLASRCSNCGSHYLPRVAICGRCWGSAFDIAPLAPVGNLYSYTIVHITPPGFPSPYAIGYVDFPEGVRVFGQIRLTPDLDLHCDMKVEVEIATLMHRPDGSGVEGYRFVPLPPESRVRP